MAEVFTFRGAVITGASVSGTKATPNSKTFTVVCDLSDSLLELLGVAFDEHLDSAKTKKVLALEECEFIPNGMGAEKHSFAMTATEAGPFTFARIKKDGGVVTECRFSVSSTQANMLALIEKWRNAFALLDGQLKVTYIGISTSDAPDALDSTDQMSFDDAAATGDIAKVAEVVANKKAAAKKRAASVTPPKKSKK